jgi:hypothetical protein
MAECDLNHTTKETFISKVAAKKSPFIYLFFFIRLKSEKSEGPFAWQSGNLKPTCGSHFYISPSMTAKLVL